jgi:hypothetical protein
MIDIRCQLGPSSTDRAEVKAARRRMGELGSNGRGHGCLAHNEAIWDANRSETRWESSGWG